MGKSPIEQHKIDLQAQRYILRYELGISPRVIEQISVVAHEVLQRLARHGYTVPFFQKIDIISDSKRAYKRGRENIWTVASFDSRLEGERDVMTVYSGSVTRVMEKRRRKGKPISRSKIITLAIREELCHAAIHHNRPIEFRYRGSKRATTEKDYKLSWFERETKALVKKLYR